MRTSQLNYLKGGAERLSLSIIPLKHPEGEKPTTKYNLFFHNLTKTRFSQKELPNTVFSKTVSTSDAVKEPQNVRGWKGPLRVI